MLDRIERYAHRPQFSINVCGILCHRFVNLQVTSPQFRFLLARIWRLGSSSNSAHTLQHVCHQLFLLSSSSELRDQGFPLHPPLSLQGMLAVDELFDLGSHGLIPVDMIDNILLCSWPSRNLGRVNKRGVRSWSWVGNGNGILCFWF